MISNSKSIFDTTKTQDFLGIFFEGFCDLLWKHIGDNNEVDIMRLNIASAAYTLSIYAFNISETDEDAMNHLVKHAFDYTLNIYSRKKHSKFHLLASSDRNAALNLFAEEIEKIQDFILESIVRRIAESDVKQFSTIGLTMKILKSFVKYPDRVEIIGLDLQIVQLFSNFKTIFESDV